jgi:hypothetical protein
MGRCVDQDVWLYGCMGAPWVYGCMVVLVCGCVGVWIRMYGCMGVWVYGCVDVWMYGGIGVVCTCGCVGIHHTPYTIHRTPHTIRQMRKIERRESEGREEERK